MPRLLLSDTGTCTDASRDVYVILESTQQSGQYMLRQYAVIIPVLNGGEVWRRVARSIQNQQPTPARVLVVDSGSADGSDQVAFDAGFDLIRIAKAMLDHGAKHQYQNNA